MNDEDISPKVKRLADATVVILSDVESLIDKGILEGPKLLSPAGKEHAEKLKSEGFVATNEEIEIVLSHFMYPPEHTVH